MLRVCFLFNHDQTHQIAHSLPIALQMVRAESALVTLAATNAQIELELLSWLRTSGVNAQVVRLSLRSPLSRTLSGTLEALLPANKLLIYRDNLDFFGSFDALVVAEKTSLLLKTRYGLDHLKIIHTRHGAGDRAIGFEPQSSKFDLVLVAGSKVAGRLVNDAGVDPARIRVIGYAKFDVCRNNVAKIPDFDPTKLTVIYNPHPSPKLSSWYRMGEEIIQRFFHTPEFNFIFAPHVMMFTRPWTIAINPPSVRRMRLPDPSWGMAPHMHIDLGSAASSDMSYTNLADIYIGDVSSQVYEFLLRPRPCLFLDAHSTCWAGDPNYAHWGAGPVVRPGDDIIESVRQAVASHPRYLPVQRELVSEAFSFTAEPASTRAAKAITQFLGEGVSQ